MGCKNCEDPDFDYASWEFEMMEKYGWYVHFVQDDSSPTGMNIHTHGVRETFKHPDFQIVIPLPQEIIQNILHGMIKQIKDGGSFDVDERYDSVINGFDVKFIWADECDRKLLRIIFPDKEGKLDAGTFVDKDYELQYE
jgi:hypothetical protein